jgi:hypothetical protein
LAISAEDAMICVMTLDKGWHFILSFALIGFLIAIVAACCMVFNAPNIITNLMIVISPGLWLFLERVFGRVGFTNYHVAWWFSVCLVAIANGVLYAIVGAVIAGLRWMLKQRDTAK